GPGCRGYAARCGSASACSGSSLGPVRASRQSAFDEIAQALRRLGERMFGTVTLAERQSVDWAVCSYFSGEDERVDPGGVCALENSADDLARERGRVEEALARDDEIRLRKVLVEAEPGGDEIEAADELGADCRQSAGEPSRGAGAREVRDDELREALV